MGNKIKRQKVYLSLRTDQLCTVSRVPISKQLFRVFEGNRAFSLQILLPFSQTGKGDVGYPLTPGKCVVGKERGRGRRIAARRNRTMA
jgi:hypothetical protein